MKYFCLAFILTASFYTSAQKTVSNPFPHVGLDAHNYLYIGHDNPVYITTGNKGPLSVSIDKGRVIPTKKTGHYIINVFETGTVTITLSGNTYKKDFLFEVRPLSFPDIALAGSPNEDGVVFIKQSQGVFPRYRYYDVAIPVSIDSFTIEVIDSLSGSIRHLNTGASWDETSKQMIRASRKGSRVFIYGVYMRLDGRKIKSEAWLEAYVW